MLVQQVDEIGRKAQSPSCLSVIDFGLRMTH